MKKGNMEEKQNEVRKTKKKGTSFKLDKEDREKLEKIQKDMAVDTMGTAIRKLIRDFKLKKMNPNDD